MSNPFEKAVAKLTHADIEEASNCDFYMWNQYIMEFSQKTYDLLNGTHSEDEPLTEKQIAEHKERLAILDAAYVHIQIAMEEVGNYLRKKYPEEATAEHIKLPY